MWLLIREASMARNLQALLPLVLEYGPGRIAFCTDDRDPEDIADNGHINGMVRDAVAAGVTAEDALVMATFHPAQWHELDRLGAIAPGYQADLLVLPDLERFVPDVVLKRGRPIEEVPPVPVPDWVRQSVRVRPVTANDFAIPSTGGQDPRDRAGRGSGRDRIARPRSRGRRTGTQSPTPQPTSRRSPSSNDTSQRAASGSGSCPARVSSVARSRPPSRTTPTTSSSWA